MNSAPKLVLGTVQWGVKYGIANRSGCPDQSEVAEMLRQAQAAGVTTLDTGRAYGDSERVIGSLTVGDPHWKIVTKLSPDADSSEAALASVAASRRELRRDKLDILLLHRAYHRVAAGGAVWDALRRCKVAEEIGQLGISTTSSTEAWTVLDDPEVSCIQVPASLFDQRLSRAGYFERAAERGKTVFVRSVFLQGAAHLEPSELPAHLRSLAGPLADARQWAAARGRSPGLAFLAFAASLIGAQVLIGCESARQLAQNLQAWNEAQQLVDSVEPLARSIPPLSDEVLNPALWPRL